MPDRPSRPGTVRPLAPERYHLHLTVDADTHAALRKLQDLLRSEAPNGDPALIVGRALSFLLAHVERRKFAATAARRVSPRDAPLRAADAGGDASARETPVAALGWTPPAASLRLADAADVGARYIPAAIRRAVWVRDEGQCTFVGPGGRCSERGGLEFHHRVPLGQGGATTVGNLALLCRSHNQWQADLDYGAGAIQPHRRRAGRTCAPSAERKAGLARRRPDDRTTAAGFSTQCADSAPTFWRDSVQTELEGPVRLSP
jgi:hypothetical protein